MGSFKHIETEIMHWQACGRTVEETYVYWKDYVTFEQVQYVFDRKCDLNPVDQ
jgi:hypothetical protein